MKKALLLQALLLSFYAGSGHAADASCIATWERDHSANYEQCVIQEKPVQCDCVEKPGNFFAVLRTEF